MESHRSRPRNRADRSGWTFVLTATRPRASDRPPARGTLSGCPTAYAAAGPDAAGEPGAAYSRGVAARPPAERRREAKGTLDRKGRRKVNRRPAPPGASTGGRHRRHVARSVGAGRATPAGASGRWPLFRTKRSAPASPLPRENPSPTGEPRRLVLSPEAEAAPLDRVRSAPVHPSAVGGPTRAVVPPVARVPMRGVAAVGKWPAGVTAESPA